MTRANRIILLGLLACLGAGAQNIYSVRVGLSIEGPRFRVDGQEYNSPQNFLWPDGSKHTIQFIYSVDDEGVPEPYQYLDNRRVRYTFGGWEIGDSAGSPPVVGPIFTIQASPTLTQILGNVAQQHVVSIEWPEAPVDTGACAGGVLNPLQDFTRSGIIYIGGICYSNSVKEVWVTAGEQVFNAFAYPGWVFSGWIVDFIMRQPHSTITVVVDHPVRITPLFTEAKRVRFSSVPGGRQIYVDTSLITLPPPIPVNTPEPVNIDPANCTPDYTRIPGNAPPGYTPLCMGDFDFHPESEHRLAAPPAQRDQAGRWWAFDKFSTGGGQNSVYVANRFINTVDYVTAFFVPGVESRVLTNPMGLKVEVDGTTAFPNANWAFAAVWAEGHTHRVSAPLTQTDAQGRKYRFVRWSDGGEAAHDITVPTGVTAYSVTAIYEILGQVKVTSVPAGLNVQVNGSSCTTPCTFDEAAGATLDLTALKSISTGDASRLDFDYWAGGQPGQTTRQATFNTGVQTITAQYHASYLVLTYTNPPDAATFEFSPPTSDGFYPEGTDVEVRVTARGGHKFLRWEGDLSGSFQPGRLKVLAPRNVIARFEAVPFIGPAGIRNAAGDTPDDTIAPGSIVSIFGEKLSAVTEVGPSNPWAQAIGNVYVTVNDRLLPLIFVSPTQINAQMLSDFADGNYTLKVHQTGQPEVTGTFTIRRNSPGLFYYTTQDGTPVVAALRQDGTPVTPDNPAQRGEIVTMFGTGFGPYNETVFDGFIAPMNKLLPLADPIAIVAALPENAALAPGAERPAPAVVEPAWAGAAPGLVGAAVVQMKIGETVPNGPYIEVFVNANGTESNRVQIPIGQ